MTRHYDRQVVEVSAEWFDGFVEKAAEASRARGGPTTDPEAREMVRAARKASGEALEALERASALKRSGKAPQALKAEEEAEAARASAEALREVLLVRNMMLLISVAKRYAGRGVLMDDLVQEGYLGFRRATELYDSGRDCPFGNYAANWIESKIRILVSKQSSKVHLSANALRCAREWRAAREDLHVESGRAPSNREVLARLGWKGIKVRNLIETARAISADRNSQHIGDMDFQLLESRHFCPHSGDAASIDVASEEESVEDLLDHGEALDDLKAKVAGLENSNQRFIITRRLGLDGQPQGTLRQIAKQLGITYQGVLDAQGRALRALKRSLSADLMSRINFGSARDPGNGFHDERSFEVWESLLEDKAFSGPSGRYGRGVSRQGSINKSRSAS